MLAVVSGHILNCYIFLISHKIEKFVLFLDRRSLLVQEAGRGRALLLRELRGRWHHGPRALPLREARRAQRGGLLLIQRWILPPHRALSSWRQGLPNCQVGQTFYHVYLLLYCLLNFLHILLLLLHILLLHTLNLLFISFFFIL